MPPCYTKCSLVRFMRTKDLFMRTKRDVDLVKRRENFMLKFNVTPYFCYFMF